MMTKGEYRVGYKFNPSNSSMVEEIKLRAADLIDLIEENDEISHASAELSSLNLSS